MKRRFRTKLSHVILVLARDLVVLTNMNKKGMPFSLPWYTKRSEILKRPQKD